MARAGYAQHMQGSALTTGMERNRMKRTADSGQLLGQTNYALQRHENLLHMKAVVKLARHTPCRTPTPGVYPPPPPRSTPSCPWQRPTQTPCAFHFSALIKSSSQVNRTVKSAYTFIHPSTLLLLLLLLSFSLCLLLLLLLLLSLLFLLLAGYA